MHESMQPQGAVSGDALGSSIATELVRIFYDLGVRHAFGVCGGAVGPLWDKLSASNIHLLHVRHEAGAAFAAMEASFATDRPALVVATTGPGLTNVITGMCAARCDGAKLILVSGRTPTNHRGRWAFQETREGALPSVLFSAGPIFDYAASLDDPSELPQVIRQLALGVARPQGFTAHLNLTIKLQKDPTAKLHTPIMASGARPMPSPESVTACAEILASEPFAIWVGYGARRAATAIRTLAERTGAPVMCSPRAKGIFPEDHPLFVGVTGLFGGQASPAVYMRERPPRRVLVLGSRLGESTSLFSQTMVPENGFIHVDVDPGAFGLAYPHAPTMPIEADVGAFLRELLGRLPLEPGQPPGRVRETVAPPPPLLDGAPVRPVVLMAALQRLVVQGSDAMVLGDPGNSFAWTTHELRFREPGRYRVSTCFASMGTAASGVIGAAVATGKKALAVVGDGSMLMTNEISTAVQYRIPAVWIVLNDARYGMVDQGQKMNGYHAGDFDIPHTDFAQIARGMGADAVRVSSEDQVEAAISAALAAPGPFLVDVLTDRSVPSPFGRNL